MSSADTQYLDMVERILNRDIIPINAREYLRINFLTRYFNSTWKRNFRF